MTHTVITQSADSIDAPPTYRLLAGLSDEDLRAIDTRARAERAARAQLPSIEVDTTELDDEIETAARAARAARGIWFTYDRPSFRTAYGLSDTEITRALASDLPHEITRTKSGRGISVVPAEVRAWLDANRASIADKPRRAHVSNRLEAAVEAQLAPILANLNARLDALPDPSDDADDFMTRLRRVQRAQRA